MFSSIRTTQERYLVTTTLAVLGGTIAIAFLRRHRERDKAERQEQLSIIETHVVSETLVKASPSPFKTQGEVLREPLSEVDEWLSRSSHWLPFCLRFDSILDEERVRVGLERTLSHIPALGARVDTCSNPIQYELVLTPDNQGVSLQIAKGRIIRGMGGKEPSLPNESSTREEWQEAGLDAPPAGFNGEPGPDDPMMRARLTIFESQGVSYLSIGISHGLGDGESIADLLQIWSHFCTSESLDGLPESLRRPRAFGRRMTQPIRPARYIAELEERVQSDVGCEVNPLSAWAFFGHLLPRAIWSMSRQQVLELRISGERIAALKAAILEALPKGEWVSRFEVVHAVLMVAQLSTANESVASDHKLHVACNLRGRTGRFASDYFGNAAFDFRQTIQLPTDVSWDVSCIVRIAQEIHRAVRNGLENPEDILKTKDWFEAARHLGIRNKYDAWPIAFDTFKGTGTFVNSWGPRWLEVSMGTKEKASAMVAYFGVAQNLLVEVPRTRATGDSTVYLALPPKHAKRFIEFCQKDQVESTHSPMLPFSIVGLDR